MEVGEQERPRAMGSETDVSGLGDHYMSTMTRC